MANVRYSSSECFPSEIEHHRGEGGGLETQSDESPSGTGAVNSGALPLGRRFPQGTRDKSRKTGEKMEEREERQNDIQIDTRTDFEGSENRQTLLGKPTQGRAGSASSRCFSIAIASEIAATPNPKARSITFDWRHFRAHE